MFCKKCGNQIDEGSAFCKKCGTPVEKAQGAAATGAGAGFPAVDKRYLQWGILISCLLMAVATALPYLAISENLAPYVEGDSMSLLNANGRAGDGVIFIILAILTAVFLYLKKDKGVLVCGVVPFVMYCYEMSQMKKVESIVRQSFGGSIGMDDIMSKGAGFYLITVSVIALLVLSILFFLQNRKDGTRNS